MLYRQSISIYIWRRTANKSVQKYLCNLWNIFFFFKYTTLECKWSGLIFFDNHLLSTWSLLYFWNPYDSLIPNMMIDTSSSSSCSRWSPRSPCFGRKISSTGPSVSPFRDFYILLEIYPKRNMEFILFRLDLACRCKFCQDIQGWDLPSKEIEFSFKFTSTFIQPKHITPCDI